MVNLSILDNLIKIRSDRDSSEILEYIKKEIEGKVEEIIEVKNKEDSKRNLIVGINTKLRNVECLVLSGHIDTVGADVEKYNTNPYSLVVDGDRAYGLGIIDMKCFTATVIDLIDEIKLKQIPVILALTGDEETTLYGVNNIICKFKELNIRPKFTIIGEPTSFEIKNVSNGCFEYKVEAFGKSCHSSTPKEGVNAICIIARLVSYIEELSFLYDELTMSCDLISGGTIINRVPDYASMSFDIRTINIDLFNDAIGKIEEKIKELKNIYDCEIKIENKLRIPPLSKNNYEVIEKLSKNLNLKVSKFLGGCEAGYYKEYSGDAILLGMGDLSLAHKPNEYMVVSDYKKYNSLLLKVIDLLKEMYF